MEPATEKTSLMLRRAMQPYPETGLPDIQLFRMKHDNILIREYMPDDADSLAALTTEMGYPTTGQEMTDRMALISQHPDYETAVAVAGGEIAGYIGLCKSRFWEQNGHFIRIQALVVKKESRRLGIGQKLVDFAEQRARQTGANMLILNCGNRPERAAAHLFYPRMGFVPKSTGYVKKLSS